MAAYTRFLLAMTELCIGLVQGHALTWAEPHPNTRSRGVDSSHELHLRASLRNTRLVNADRVYPHRLRSVLT